LILIAVLMAVQGGVASAQFLRQGAVGLAWMGEGALDPAGQGVSVIEAGGQRWLRAYGLTAHPNVLGGYLAMSILICLGALRSVKRGGRPFVWAAIVLGALGLFCSFSRSAWLGTAAGLAYLGATTQPWQGLDWRSPHVRRALAVAGVLLAASGLALALLYGELLRARLLRLGSPLEATSIQERLVDYAQAWGLIRDVPLKGVGSGYYILALWAGVGEDRPPGFRKVHDAYLLATAELGVVGAVAWASTLLVAPLAVARRAWRSDRRGGLRARPEAGWAAAFCCALVLCFFDSYLYVPSTWWAALFMGLLAAGYALAAGRERGGEAD
jgi:O-antigen ligase